MLFCCLATCFIDSFSVNSIIIYSKTCYISTTSLMLCLTICVIPKFYLTPLVILFLLHHLLFWFFFFSPKWGMRGMRKSKFLSFFVDKINDISSNIFPSLSLPSSLASILSPITLLLTLLTAWKHSSCTLDILPTSLSKCHWLYWSRLLLSIMKKQQLSVICSIQTSRYSTTSQKKSNLVEVKKKWMLSSSYLWSFSV